MRRVFALLLLAGVAHAQAFTNVVWPPRDVDVREDFGTLVVALDEGVLAVLDRREGQPSFVRTYVREGLNWIEDGRLPVQPATFRGLHGLDVDGDRVLVSGSGGLEIFRRFGARDWLQRTVPLPASVAGRVEVGDLSGDWLAAASTEFVALLQRQGDEWVAVQEIPTGVLYQIALDGDDLLVVERFRLASIYRRSGSTWTSEFRVGTEAICDLSNDRLAIVLGGMFRSYDRVGTGWSLSGTFPSDALRVRLTGDHAVLGLSPPYTVLRREGGAWTSLGELQGPDGAQLGFDVAARGALVAVTSFQQLTENLRGAVHTFALDEARATLHASALRMALEPGGTLRLTLDAGPASAGLLFVLAGSLSGSSPGFRALDRRIPLNRREDPYYPRSVQSGRLDADGRSMVEVVLPPTQPGEPLALFLKDRTFHHAFVVWDGRRIAHVSNVALTAIVGRLH